MGRTAGVKKQGLKSMTPATKTIFKLMESGDRFTAGEIKEITGYSIRTVRYSLKDLYERGLVEKKTNLLNMRITQYQIARLATNEANKETVEAIAKTERLKSSMAKIKGPR